MPQRVCEAVVSGAWRCEAQALYQASSIKAPALTLSMLGHQQVKPAPQKI